MELKDSKTFENLQKAFQGESLASTKYRIFAHKAEEQGFDQIAQIFAETSGNEQEHAELWYKLLNGGEMPDTLENLEAAAKGEEYEWTSMYPEFAKVAEEEGFTDIADLFKKVGSIEKHHDYRYSRLIENVENKQVVCKPTEQVWKCRNCGYLHYGECAPKVCPVCGYPQGNFEINCENY